MSKFNPVGKLFRFKESDFRKDSTFQELVGREFLCYKENVTYEILNRGGGSDPKTSALFFEKNGDVIQQNVSYELVIDWWANDVSIKNVDVVGEYHITPVSYYQFNKKEI